jgi:hypothetical protein
MSNFELPPAAIVSQLQRLLREGYGLDEGHLSIFKEIVQNADDAGARRLHLVLMRRGIEGAANTLLHGPALACINDGPFTPDHYQAIRAMSITSKAEDASKIGRFGLGQKSVFHLCEAYFYLGWSAGEPELAGVLDPWARRDGDPGHKSWDQFEARDVEAVLDRVSPWTGPRGAGAGGFVLYLPLRRIEHRRPRGGGVIAQHYPDLDALARDLAELSALAHVLPQLHHVTTIETWELEDGVPRQLAGIRCAVDAARLSRPGEETRAFERSFGGKIEILRGAAVAATLQFFGHERVADSPLLAALKANERWPKRVCVTPDDEEKPVPEPAVAHGAVTLIRADGGGDAASGVLRAAWAVFLPLRGDDESQAISRVGRWQLLLHGYFFPDSGRRRVLGVDSPCPSGAPTREDEVPEHWNALLRDLATAPCLLPAVQAALEATEPQVGEDLARDLASSKLWLAVQAAATTKARLVWGPHVPSGTTSAHSRMRPLLDNRAMIPVPRPAVEELQEPGVAEILRAVTSVEAKEHVVVVWENGPLLSAPGGLQPWTDRALRKALDAIDPHVLADDRAARYLSRWLSSQAPLHAESSRALVKLLQKGLAQEEAKPWWRALSALCPPDSIVWGDPGDQLLQAIAKLGAPVIVLPTNLVPEPAPPSPVLALQDVYPILVLLGNALHASPTDPRAGELAKTIVERVGANAIIQDPRLAKLPLLRLWSAREKGFVCASWSALQGPRSPVIVLRRSGLFGAEGMARRLLGAIHDPDADVLLANDDALANSVGAVRFGADVIVRLFGDPRARLADVVQRHDLFRALVLPASGGHAAVTPADVKRDSDLYHALRLLLHGDVDRRQSGADLFVLPTLRSRLEPVAEVERELLAASGEGWRLLPESLAGGLSRDWLAALGIEQLTPRLLADVLSANGGSWREEVGLRFDAEGRRQVRALLASAGDIGLFQALAIHESDRGLTRAAAGRVYVASDWPLPERLAEYVTLVRRDPAPAVAHFQRQAFRPWSPGEQVKLCLELRASTEIALAILDALPLLGTELDDLAPALRTETWVPSASADGRFIRPGDVLDLPHAVDQAMRRLLGASSGEYPTPGALAAEVQKHKAFPLFCQCLTLQGKAALDAAALQLEDLASQPLWILPHALPAGQRRFLEQGARLGSLGREPAWSLVRALREAYQEDWYDRARELWKVMAKGPTGDRLVDLLGLLTEEAEPRAQADARELHAEYVREARRRDDFEAAILPRLRLRDAGGHWRSAGDLVAWGPSLEPRYRLHREEVDLLQLDRRETSEPESVAAPGVPRDAPGAADEDAAAAVLEHYLQSLRRAVSEVALGYFVAMFGDGRGGALKALAEGLLAGRDAQLAREKLCTLSGYVFSNEPGLLQRARWAFRIRAGSEEVVVTSLTGQTLRARVASEAVDLFIERPPALRASSAQEPRWLQLRAIEPGALADEALANAVKRAVFTFIESAAQMTIPPAALDAFWAEVGRGGSARIDPVRRWMLRRLPDYVTTLVGQRDPQLGELTRAIELTSYRQEAIPGGGDAARALAAARQKLEQLVEQDAGVQARLVAAVRGRVEGSGYEAPQVVFELFQNADDAATQLAELRGRRLGADERARRFAVQVASADGVTSVLVRHWGRGINQMSDATGEIERARERGYELDLKRMLVLNESDKDASMTGRFGLGFKSVYLLTDTPRLRDAQMSLEIVAGFLPRQRPTSAVAIERATTFELPLRDPALLEPALGRLRSYGGLLALFGQTIRRVELDAGARGESNWQPVPGDPIPGVEVGELRVELSAGAPVVRVLAMRHAASGPHAVLAFRLGGRGVQPLDAAVPTIWCTAPTRESWGIGFCANGPFVLDVGRAKLSALAGANDAVYRRLGDLLYESMLSLHESLAQRFEATADVLGLERGAHTPDEVRHRFWESVFDQLTEPLLRSQDSPARHFARTLNDQGRGLSGLLRNLSVLPTHLPGAHAQLTRLADVRWVLDEVTASRRILECLPSLPWGHDKPMPGACIASSVAERLDQLGVAWPRPPRPLGLAQVLAHLKSLGGRTDSKLAVLLSDLRDAIKASGLDGRTVVAALDELHEHSTQLLFQGNDKEWKGASALILGEQFRQLVERFDANRRDQHTDEILRATFAPPSAVLHGDYAKDARAVELFLFARRDMMAHARQLALWARDARTEAAQDAVVRYLARGSLGKQLVDEIVRGVPWWTRGDLEQIANRAGLDAHERDKLLVALFPKQVTLTFVPSGEGDEPRLVVATLRVSQPREVVQKIVAWWSRVGVQRVKAFQRDVFPGGTCVEDLGARLAKGDRPTWIMLLTLGACQRLGRQTPAQHRGFIDLLRSRGQPRWWDVVTADPRRGQMSDWMGILEQWMGDADAPDDDSYRLWFGLFPTLYRIHRHADVYTELLLKAPLRPPGALHPNQLLEPKTDHQLGGTGGRLDVPRLWPTLGIGVPWVLRELLWLGAFKGTLEADLRRLWPFCFVPRLATRELLARLGASDLGGESLGGASAADQSQRIHHFLVSDLGLSEDTARFGDAFDIPLYLIATDGGARQEANVAEDLR